MSNLDIHFLDKKVFVEMVLIEKEKVLPIVKSFTCQLSFRINYQEISALT